MGRINTHLLCVVGQFVTQPNKTPLELNATRYCFQQTQHQSLDFPEFPLKLQTFCPFPLDLVPVTPSMLPPTSNGSILTPEVALGTTT